MRVSVIRCELCILASVFLLSILSMLRDAGARSVKLNIY